MFLTKIKEIHVEPTTVCQAECPMCPRTIQGYHMGKKLNKFLTLESFIEKTKSFITDLDKVLFCGTLGEPVACKDLLAIISYILEQNKDCVIGINSNGGIKDTTWWQELASLIKFNLYSYVVFSIDGLEDTNHLYRRNVDWNVLIENAKAYIAAGGLAHWDMLVFKHNEHQVQQAKKLAKDLGFNFFRTKVSSRFNPNDEFKPPTNHVEEHIETLFSCMAKDTQSLYLSAEGFWYPCCFTHMSNETQFDLSWGKPIANTNNQFEWNELDKSFAKNPPSICKRSCGTTYNKGQWTSEYRLNV